MTATDSYCPGTYIFFFFSTHGLDAWVFTFVLVAASSLVLGLFAFFLLNLALRTEKLIFSQVYSFEIMCNANDAM